MKKVLILGGTSFIGRNLVGHLIQKDDLELTLFNRQRTGADLFPTLRKMKGDRETADIHQISAEEWDVVIDVSCYYPNALQLVLDNLKIAPERYIFISTCSVYDSANDKSPSKPENAETLSCSTAEAVDRSIDNYGNRKAECERILQKSYMNYTILRPALVYGKYDPTDRFYYWLYQVKMNKELLLPEQGKRKFSLTFVSDLVDLISTSIYNSTNGIFNAVSHVNSSIETIVEAAKSGLDKNPNSMNASAAFLEQEQISQWMEMPLWINGDHFTFSNQKAKKELSFEPRYFDETVVETIAFYDKLDWLEPTYGIAESQRLKLLQKLQ